MDDLATAPLTDSRYKQHWEGAAAVYWVMPWSCAGECRWHNRPYLAGEVYEVYTPQGAAKVPWTPDAHRSTPLTWSVPLLPRW